MNAILPQPSPFPDDGAIREAVTRLCGSSAFQGSPQLRVFLHYIVETKLTGEAASIKAYSVAVGALGRPERFDPASDAIVRIEAGRLRTALARNYDDADDGLVISLARGSYVPQFRWREDGDAMISAARSSEAKAVYETRRVHQAAFHHLREQLSGAPPEIGFGP